MSRAFLLGVISCGWLTACGGSGDNGGSGGSGGISGAGGANGGSAGKGSGGAAMAGSGPAGTGGTASGGATGCGDIGSQCSTDCAAGLECNGGLCVPAERPSCGGFNPMECPGSRPNCLYCTGCDFGDCFTDDALVCLCAAQGVEDVYAGCP